MDSTADDWIWKKQASWWLDDEEAAKIITGYEIDGNVVDDWLWMQGLLYLTLPPFSIVGL